MTTVQKWYLLVITFIIGILYSFTLFDAHNKNTLYFLIHMLLFIGLFTEVIFIFCYWVDEDDLLKHYKYLYKEFIKVIKFYLNL